MATTYEISYGGNQARVTYTLDDGRTITRGPWKCASLSEAQTKAAAQLARVEAWQRDQDAEEAVTLGTVTANRTATLSEVKSKFLEMVNSLDDPCDIYDILKNINRADIPAKYLPLYDKLADNAANITAWKTLVGEVRGLLLR